MITINCETEFDVAVMYEILNAADAIYYTSNDGHQFIILTEDDSEPDDADTDTDFIEIDEDWIKNNADEVINL